MALQSHQEPAAAEKYLDVLTNDPAARDRYLAAGHDGDAVAREIADATGMPVAASNLAGIAKHLTTDAGTNAKLDALANSYPAMNFIIVKTA